VENHVIAVMLTSTCRRTSITKMLWFYFTCWWKM